MIHMLNTETRSLYRKHRPKSFKDIAGQEHITDVLKRSIEEDKVVHAYLFSGPKGTGKTTMARVFANKLKCIEDDITEIDAASHTSVENIRQLSEDMHTAPLSSPYRVFILDEIHMLSQAAFNAFLKSLEEPPEHVIFILVTTEEHKLPETIVSRCQTFKFRKPSINVLNSVIKKVAKIEGYKIAEQGATTIAITSDGSFRDALGNLQKVLTIATNEDVSQEIIETATGAPKNEIVNAYIKALVYRDAENGLKALDEAVEAGNDMTFFGRLVVRKIRSTMLLKITKEKDILKEYGDRDGEFLQGLADQDELDIDLLNKVIYATMQSSKAYMTQLPFEILLLEPCKAK